MNRIRFLWLLLPALWLAACSQTSIPPDLSVSADPSSLYAQLDNATDTYYVGGSLPGNFIADDFVVPDGEIWTIDEVEFAQILEIGFLQSPAVAFFAANPANPGLPGAPITQQFYNRSAMFVRNGLSVVPLPSSVVLQPGTYWVGVDNWYVRGRTQPIGQRAVSGTVGSFAPLFDPEDLVFGLAGSIASLYPPALSIFANGAVHRTSGVATVSGVMTCEYPGTWTVRVELRQRQRKTPVEGVAQVDVACNGETTWAAAVRPTSGAFKPGLADAAVETPGATASNRVLKTINLR